MAICNCGQLLFWRNALWHHRGQGTWGTGQSFKDISSLGALRLAKSLVKRHFGVSGEFGPSYPEVALEPCRLDDDATRNLLGLEPQARHGAMCDPSHHLVIPGTQPVSETLCSVRPSASSWPLDIKPMLVANSIASAGGKGRGSLFLTRFSPAAIPCIEQPGHWPHVYTPISSIRVAHFQNKYLGA